MQNKAHGQNINFLLVNSASRECIGIMLGQAILNSQYTEFYVFIFCVKLEIVGSLKLISHPGHSILGGGEQGTRFMPTSLRGVPDQNLRFTSSFSHSDGQEQECEYLELI